jgi:anti-sigma regulatory factor (Ser/Thr protein kinase)
MKAETVKRTVRLEPSYDSVGTARRAVREALIAAPRQFVADAVLLTSELATNAVVHTGRSYRVSLAFDRVAGFLRVEVVDRSDDQLRVPPRSEGQVGGLGLGIVDATSTRWGTRRRRSGKSVWFELGPNHSTNEPSVAATTLRPDPFERIQRVRHPGQR